MPVNGHHLSPRTVFAPSQDGPSRSSRISVTADASPSAVRPDGLPAARDLTQSESLQSGVSPVDGERPRGGGWQDNAVLRTAQPASSQPAPGTEGVRRSGLDTVRDPAPESDDLESRSARLTLRVKPRVKTALQRLADDDDLSLSETAATGLEVYTRAEIHDQEETLFEPRMRSMLRREVRSSDDRHLPFEIKNAIASEQTRSIVTDLYKRLLAKDGLSQEQISAKLRKHYQQARVNIFKNTPQQKAMLDEYWQMIEQQAGDGGAMGKDAREPSGRGGTGTRPSRT